MGRLGDGIGEGMCRGEHWVLCKTGEPQTCTPETSNAYYYVLMLKKTKPRTDKHPIPTFGRTYTLPRAFFIYCGRLPDRGLLSPWVRTLQSSWCTRTGSPEERF